MTAPTSSDEDDPPRPQTPQHASAAKKKHTPNAATPTTPLRKASTPAKDASPKAAPAAGRPRVGTAKQHTLLGDFLLGRPSPARVAADRQAAREAAKARRKSLELVKHEMRQTSVLRVQAPGGVHDRVKKWQKANAATMANADPLATPTEPSEVNVQVDAESVTEEDRVRIKSRKKKPQAKSETEHQTDGSASSKENQSESRLSNPPKKRVVSDTNWVKDKKKSPPRSRSPKTKPKESTGSPLPKDFLARTAANPSVSKKIKDWAGKVEIPDETHNKRRSAPMSMRSTSSGDGIRVKPVTCEEDSMSGRSGSANVTTETNSSWTSKELENDGIRIGPISSGKDIASKGSGSSRVATEPSRSRIPRRYEDDGIRVTPIPSKIDTTSWRSGSSRIVKTSASRKTQGQEEDGIRIKPIPKQGHQNDSFKAAKVRTTLTQRGRAKSGSDIQSSDAATAVRASSRQSSSIPSTIGPSTRKDPSSSSRIEVTEDSVPDKPQTSTPTPGPAASKMRPKEQPKHAQKPVVGNSRAETDTIVTGETSDNESWSSDSVSDMPFSTLQQSLADIPVGYSAFSELDLHSGPKGQKSRPKTKRQSSFKDATNVLKKALTEGKKILTEKVDPPKPVVNQPQNIETWLKDTVDPFVDSPSVPEAEHKGNSKGDPVEQSKTHRSTSSKHRPADSPCSSDVNKSEETINLKEPEEPGHDKPSNSEATTPTPSGLKRSRATRISSSPLKSTGRKGLKEKLKDAFRGESTGLSPPPFEYPSCSEVVDLDQQQDGENDTRERRRSSGTGRSPSPDDYDSLVSSEPAKRTSPAAYHNRKPPTHGLHELSTIVSEVESHSTFQSDLSSIVSDSTITESTVLTRNSAVSRKRSHKSGLKRRLTKHSDLVSVLSLPDDASAPTRTNSLRAAHSVRRSSQHLGSATVDALLQEFEDDEDLYQRELKTLVDGIIPVLLTQFVNNTSNTRKDLFGSPPTKYKEDTLDNAVVNMGIALDSLRSHHRRCPPLSDIRKLPQWLEAVQPIYNNYLDVWRLGFQGIIVNLAPRSVDDADSLIDAMPRNEQGDILNEDGDRIDVAHLLKRPLVRIKWISKFIKGYRAIVGTKDFESLAAKWEALEEKARRRHKEENARVIDEDAKNTDTSLTRDLRTLEALDNVRIDRFRQVFAKDTFSLDLRHSNGQRLECQVELIIRDNQLFKSDPGDLLIRETGNGGRSWLLFAPVAGGRFSARSGDNEHELVVMIRGHRDEWFELLSLTTDNEDQVLDWLDMLGGTPIPPAVKKGLPTSASQPLVSSPKSAVRETPLGERKLHLKSTIPSTPTEAVENLDDKPRTPARYHKKASSLPNTPSSAPKTGTSTPSPERTPTQDSYLRSGHALPIHSTEDGAQDPLASRKLSPNSTPYREDGAPPPPVHRTFNAKKSPVLSPPVDQNTSRLKRRTSSPLKHEYHPSDISSEGSASPMSGDDSVSEDSSEDEFEAADIPETTPAISIKKHAELPSESTVSESNASAVPSTSTSTSPDTFPQPESKQPEYVVKSVASISYWDNKHGRWQDLWPDLCSIVTSPGLIEAYPYRRSQPSSHGSEQGEPPLVALDLTPLVMLRNSTVVDLEIRSPVLNYSRLYAKVVKYETSFFRFRVQSVPECESLYMAVHRARMDNAKYKALEEETRVRAFGQHQTQETEGDKGSNRRSWFGRKNSYRASARAPSQSAGSTSHSSGVSASSFLRKLTGGGNQSFNIAMSTVDRQSRFGGGEASMYTSASSGTPPRSPSVSAANSGSTNRMSLTTNNLRIRLHLMVSASRWEDYGNCLVEITRPDTGTRQNLRKYQGMEKRVIVTRIPKRGAEEGVVVLDVVLGSQCFSQLGSRGVLLNVWEEVKDESGQAGVAPQGGGSGGMVRKWCFQCSSVGQARWIFGLVTQEVVIG